MSEIEKIITSETEDKLTEEAINLTAPEESPYTEYEDAAHIETNRPLEQYIREAEEPSITNLDFYNLGGARMKFGLPYPYGIERNIIKIDAMPNMYSYRNFRTRIIAKKRKKASSNVPYTPVKRRRRNKKRKPFYQLFEGVTVVLTGIPNPERLFIRKKAIAMGAKYKSVWGSGCTHLICGFTNADKFHQVKGRAKIVNKKWISDCYSKQKRLSWKRYSLKSPDLNDILYEERHHEAIKKSSPYTDDATERSGDEGNATESVVETEDGAPVDSHGGNKKTRNSTKLCPRRDPDFLMDKTIYIDEMLSYRLRQLLLRYITMFEGNLGNKWKDKVDYVISTARNAETMKSTYINAHVVTPGWVWECHNMKQLVPTGKFEL